MAISGLSLPRVFINYRGSFSLRLQSLVHRISGVLVGLCAGDRADASSPLRGNISYPRSSRLLFSLILTLNLSYFRYSRYSSSLIP